MSTNDHTYDIYGPPGCGKTTYLEGQARKAIEARGTGKIVIGSLTKAAAVEMKSRGLDIPDNQIGTLHSLCYKALGIKEIADTPKGIKKWNEDNSDLQLSIERGKSLDDLGGVEYAVSGTSDREFTMMNMFRAQMTDERVWPDSVVYFSKRWKDWVEQCGMIDFSGMIERCIEETYQAPGFPEILIGDECQDWSALEMKLFRDHWGQQAEMVILAGDPDQSIFEWRGADPGVFMNHPVPEKNKRVLDQSYRLPKQAHAKAQAWIRQVINREDVEFKPKDVEGEVVYSSASFDEPEELIPLIRSEIEQEKTVMVLGSCRYMLNGIISLLKAEAIPFHNPYRPQQNDWNPLKRVKDEVWPVDRILSFLRPDEGTWGEQAQEWLSKDMRIWLDTLKAKDLLTHGVKTFIKGRHFSTPPTDDEFQKLFLKEDDADKAIMLDLNWYRSNALSKYQRKLDYLVSITKKYGGALLRGTPKVCVGTIHSVKGGEADTVIIFPDISARALDSMENDLNCGFDSVVRTFYVGLTRTKNKLVICSPREGMGGSVDL